MSKAGSSDGSSKSHEGTWKMLTAWAPCSPTDSVSKEGGVWATITKNASMISVWNPLKSTTVRLCYSK